MKSLFRRYFQSIISPDEFEQFNGYILDERNSSNIFRLMEAEWRNQQEEDVLKSPDLLVFSKVQQRILEEEALESTKKIKFYSVLLRIAAVLIVGLLTAVSVFYIRQSQLLPEANKYQTVTVPFGAKTRFLLPDGTSVWLNSGTSLSYSNNFLKQRQVQLNGEAFFDVVKDKIPFVVSTELGKIQVLGTAFNVLAYKDEFATTLERGIVKVQSVANTKELIINPGQQVLLSGNVLIRKSVDTKLFTSWKDGKLIFSRAPFQDVIKRIERWYNVRIEYSESGSDDLWFSGTLENETLTEVMDMICKSAHMKYSYDSKGRTINVEPL